MLKNALNRGVHGFIYAIATNVILALIIMILVNKPGFVPLVPDYAAHFDSEIVALLLQIVLIGLTSAAFGAGSVILEIERWSLLKQSIVYFIVTTAIWIPVSIFCWGVDKYKPAFISIICSYAASYIITWVIQFSLCKKSVASINQKLLQMNENELDDKNQ